jgi:hypothetical protein
MSIRKIKYKGKVQTVKQWSIELNIPTKTIYQRLQLGWPPELVLSSKYFNYCDDLKAANKVEHREGYPTKIVDNSELKTGKSCCWENDICTHAVPISPWSDVSNDPSEAHYYCKLLGIFVWGETPQC